MNPCNKFIALSTFALLLAGAAVADTLELKDGRVLQGRFLGGTQAVLRFEWNGEVKTFGVSDIVALTFTANYHEQDNAPPPAQVNGAAPPAPDNGASPDSRCGSAIGVRHADGKCRARYISDPSLGAGPAHPHD